jgi:thioredoxin-dependent peroxiredoxin
MASGPQVGDRAPHFALDGTDGLFRLSDHRGRCVVVLFYPGDETPVCTRQFSSYRDRDADMADLDAVIVGISPSRASTICATRSTRRLRARD